MPERLPVLPMRSTVIHPGELNPVLIGKPSSMELIQSGETFVAVPVRAERDEIRSAADLHPVGVVCAPCAYSTHDASEFGGTSGQVVYMAPLGGTRRARLVELEQTDSWLVGHFDYIEETVLRATDPVATQLRAASQKFVVSRAVPQIRDQLEVYVATLPIANLAGFLGSHMDLPWDTLVSMLEATEHQRARILIDLMSNQDD